MEIEAKFSVPNRRTYRELCKLEGLAGFVLTPLPTQKVQDEYLDTPDRRILEAGYVCRLREGQAGVTATMKSLGGVTGVVHRRQELEVRLPGREANPVRWPAGAAGAGGEAGRWRAA